MKRIRICDEAEARVLREQGLLYQFIESRIDEHPCFSLKALKDWKRGTVLGLGEARRQMKDYYEPVMLECGDRAAVHCGDLQAPEVMWRIGNVWVPAGRFEEGSIDLLFERPTTVKLNVESKGELENTARLLSLKIWQPNVYYVVDDDEVWTFDIGEFTFHNAEGEHSTYCYPGWRAVGIKERLISRENARKAKRKQSFGEM